LHCTPRLSHDGRRFGLEGLITFRKDIQYNAEDYEIVVNQNGRDVRIGVFDKVTVVIEVDRVCRQVK
jgi:exosome complex exonuclease DIS3/RRP44